MALPNIFSPEVTATLIDRIERLKPDLSPKWGKMNAAQMLAHCNVSYEMAFENKHAKPNFFLRFILGTFIKPVVVNETPFKQGSRTAPAFIIADERDFNAEKKRLIDYIHKTEALGAAGFDQKESLSFGKLTSTEWNNLFYKHLNHHLSQFGV